MTLTATRAPEPTTPAGPAAHGATISPTGEALTAPSTAPSTRSSSAGATR